MDRPDRKTLALCLVYMAALVLAAVAVDRALSTALYRHPTYFVPPYRSGYHTSVGWKMHLLTHLDTTRLDGIFLGNSLTMMDVDPAVVDRTLAAHDVRFRSFNTAIPSVGVTFWPTFARRLLKRPYPRVILLGIQPRDADTTGTAYTTPIADQFYASGAYRNRTVTTPSQAATEALDRAYVLWARSGSFLAALGSRRAGLGAYDPDDIRVVNAEGWGVTTPRFHVPAATLLAGKRRYETAAAGPPYQLAPEAAAALRDLQRLAAAGGGRLIVFSMPMLYDRTPGETPARARAFAQQLHALAKRDGFVFLDLRPRIGKRFAVGDYADANHLDEPGAALFSRLLGDELARVLRATRA